MMNQNYNAFDRVSVPEYVSSEQRVGHIYQMVMKKAELPNRHHIRGKKRVLLVAAICAVGLLTVAAGYFTASDAFRGHLKEQGNQGEAVELSSMSPLVDKTGQVITLDEPVVSNGIQITPRAIAGDDSTFTILFDIERVDGEPIGLRQTDGSISGANLMFRGLIPATPSLETDNSGWSIHTLESTINGSKGTILLRVDTHKTVPMGETLQISFKELLQQATLPGKETGLSAEKLYDALSAFPPVSDDAFQEAGFYSEIGSSLTDYTYNLVADSEISVPLGGALEGYTLTNAAIRDGQLYLRGYAPLGLTLHSDLRGCALVNESTGSSIRHTSIAAGHPSEETNGMQPWGLTFDGVSSLEQLQEYTLLANHGDNMQLLAQGEWVFDIPLQYEKVMKEIPLHKQVALKSQGILLEQVDISPYKVSIKLIPDDKGQESLEEISGFISCDEITLEMQNGSSIALLNQSMFFDYADVADDPPPTELITVIYELEAIIDPEQVVALTFGGQRYTVG